jgi:hypothetical protein
MTRPGGLSGEQVLEQESNRPFDPEFHEDDPDGGLQRGDGRRLACDSRKEVDQFLAEDEDEHDGHDKHDVPFVSKAHAAPSRCLRTN